MYRKIKFWWNKQYSEPKIKVTYYNRKKVAKIIGIITALCFIALLGIVSIAPETLAETTLPSYQIVEPYKTFSTIFAILFILFFIIFDIIYYKSTNSINKEK